MIGTSARPDVKPQPLIERPPRRAQGPWHPIEALAGTPRLTVDDYPIPVRRRRPQPFHPGVVGLIGNRPADDHPVIVDHFDGRPAVWLGPGAERLPGPLRPPATRMLAQLEAAPGDQRRPVRDVNKLNVWLEMGFHHRAIPGCAADENSVRDRWPPRRQAVTGGSDQ